MSFTSFREFVTVVEAKLSGLTGTPPLQHRNVKPSLDTDRRVGPCYAYSWNRRALRSWGVAVALATMMSAPWIASESATLRALCVCWLLWLLKLAHGLAARSRMQGPVLTIDRCGITDLRVSPQPFFWQDIASVDPIDMERGRVVELFLRNPDAVMAGRGSWLRFGGWLQRRMDLPALTLNLLLVDAKTIDVVGAIASFHPGAVPRDMTAAVERRTSRR